MGRPHPCCSSGGRPSGKESEESASNARSCGPDGTKPSSVNHPSWTICWITAVIEAPNGVDILVPVLERISSLNDETLPSAFAETIPTAGATMKFPRNPSSVGPVDDEG